MDSLDYVEVSEDEALDLALNNNKGIVKIILDDGNKSYMESSSISLGDLQGEKFVVDNENEEVKESGSFP